MIGWIDTIIAGLMLGGLYALFATGLSLAFGVMRMVNIAHGDFIVLGSFVALVVVSTIGIGPWWALLIVVPIMAVFGYLLQRGVLNLTLGTDIMPPLLVTFGLGIVIQNLLLQIFSADTQALSGGQVVTMSLQIGPVSIGLFPLVILITAVAVLIALQLMFSKTATGRAFRATSDDQEVASLMGVNNKHMYGLAMAVAMAIVGIAGVFLGMRQTFAPSDGPAYLLTAFEVVIIGGLGNLWGTLIGGMIIGVSNVVGAEIDSTWGSLPGHLVFLAILLFRPQGLFPKTRDR